MLEVDVRTGAYGTSAFLNNDHFNQVWTKPFMVKLLHQLSCGDVLAIEPHLIPYLIQWCFSTIGVIELVHVISCSSEG